MHIAIFVTVSNKKEAELIAKRLIESKLAACVNIIDRVNSLFWWEARADKAKELLLIIKSKKSKFKNIVKTVKSLHSYKVPEIIALPIILGEEKYLKWIDESLS